MDACLALLADDINWTNIGSTKFSGTYSGKQALIADLLAPLFSQLKAGISSHIERLAAESDIVVAETSRKGAAGPSRPAPIAALALFAKEQDEFTGVALDRRIIDADIQGIVLIEKQL